MEKFQILSIVLVVLLVAIIAFFTLFAEKPFSQKSMDEKRTEFISEKNSIQGELLSKGKFKCCLEKPCAYCIEKSPGHGEGATCNCLGDVVNGVHPCGECIGEIMEGHGNPYLSKYFARAIAEKMGKEHLPSLKQMMFEKYDVAIEDQYNFS
jgi:hypothetical protein